MEPPEPLPENLLDALGPLVLEHGLHTRDFSRHYEGYLTVLESAEFSATFWRPVTCAHSRRATVR
jgi:hypothetical protein